MSKKVIDTSKQKPDMLQASTSRIQLANGVLQGYDEFITLLENDIMVLYSSARDITEFIMISEDRVFTSLFSMNGKHHSNFLHQGNFIIDNKIYQKPADSKIY
jgi:hypothetical protein